MSSTDLQVLWPQLVECQHTQSQVAVCVDEVCAGQRLPEPATDALRRDLQRGADVKVWHLDNPFTRGQLDSGA